jgi:mRNA-degrading endonuclease RelE of RelBE toxin-antitoxin system
LQLISWKLEFKPKWDKHFKKFDKSIQKIILKKFDKMEQPLLGRGLHSMRYQVEEVGQHRIAFIQDEEKRIKYIYFVGTHKQYEKWLKEN